MTFPIYGKSYIHIIYRVCILYVQYILNMQDIFDNASTRTCCPGSSPNRTVVAKPWVIILWAYSVCPTDSLWMSMGLYYPNILGMISIDYTENPMNQQCTLSGTTFRVLNTKKDARFVHPTPDHDTYDIYIYIPPGT